MVYFNAGVQFSFNLSATLDYDETETSIKTGESKKTSDDKSYSKFINTMDENDEGFKVSMKHMRMQTGIIYWF